MITVGIISDTHGVYREEWKEYLCQCDYILHAGDVGSEEAYNWFMNLDKPVYIVRGNCDKGDWAEYLPETMTIPIAGRLFLMIHNRAFLPMNLEEIDFIVYGHTHFPADEVFRGIRCINPGTAAKERGAGRSMMMLYLDEKNVTLKKVSL